MERLWQWPEVGGNVLSKDREDSMGKIPQTLDTELAHTPTLKAGLEKDIHVPVFRAVWLPVTERLKQLKCLLVAKRTDKLCCITQENARQL